MFKYKTLTLVVSSTILATLAGSSLYAADVDLPSRLPAVSGINGKIEASAGWADIDGLDDTGTFRGGASLSIPVGDLFGLQADFAAVNQFNDTAIGGTLHAFTRDPNAYLFGAIGGFGHLGSTDLYYVGPEVELYLDSVSIEATGGYMNVDFGGSSRQDVFAIGDLAFYATENFRLDIGASTIAGFKSGHAGLEYLLADTGVPVALTLDGRLGDDNFRSISAGFKFYFGGDSSKSLIHRQREDDPRNRSLDIFAAAGSAFNPPGSSVPVDPCVANPPGEGGCPFPD